MPAIAMFVTGGLTFLSLLVLLYIYKDPTAQLICLASARTFWNIIKNLTFLPFYGARCLNLKWNFSIIPWQSLFWEFLLHCQYAKPIVL